MHRALLRGLGLIPKAVGSVCGVWGIMIIASYGRAVALCQALTGGFYILSIISPFHTVKVCALCFMVQQLPPPSPVTPWSQVLVPVCVDSLSCKGATSLIEI